MTVDQIAELRRARYNATVVALKRIHSDLMIMRVRPDAPPPLHEPGQYCTLGLGMWEPRFPGCQDEMRKPGDEGRVIRRAYSLSCAVLDDHDRLLDLHNSDWLEFYIVLVRENDNPEKAPALTPRLFMLREGDRIQLGDRITGHFTLEGVQPTDTVLFLSTGTGEAPHNYMTWELLKRRHKGSILSECCVRYCKDLGYLPMHEKLMAAHSNYYYVPLTTREASSGGKKVYIQEMITSGEIEKRLGKALDPSATHVYLCGNPNMIGVPVKDRETNERRYPKTLGVVEILETRYGFAADNPTAKFRGNIHFEEYW